MGFITNLFGQKPLQMIPRSFKMPLFLYDFIKEEFYMTQKLGNETLNYVFDKALDI